MRKKPMPSCAVEPLPGALGDINGKWEYDFAPVELLEEEALAFDKSFPLKDPPGSPVREGFQ
ncbi:MAG: hypothetical protein LBN38_01945 [Verrucomicrobiota bacterium]|jgi:hypothetical protein|nr:hypothetical protein [Verrucomicrobiota bacterium]